MPFELPAYAPIMQALGFVVTEHDGGHLWRFPGGSGIYLDVQADGHLPKLPETMGDYCALLIGDSVGREPMGQVFPTVWQALESMSEDDLLTRTGVSRAAVHEAHGKIGELDPRGEDQTVTDAMAIVYRLLDPDCPMADESEDDDA